MTTRGYLRRQLYSERKPKQIPESTMYQTSQLFASGEVQPQTERYTPVVNSQAAAAAFLSGETSRL